MADAIIAGCSPIMPTDVEGVQELEWEMVGRHLMVGVVFAMLEPLLWSVWVSFESRCFDFV